METWMQLSVIMFLSSMTYSAAEMGVLRDFLPRLAEKEFGYCFLKK